MTAMRAVRSRADGLAVGALSVAGIGAAVVIGAAAAGQHLIALGAIGWLSLVAIGLRAPAVPFAIALLPYALVSTYASDNALIPGAEQLHATFQPPFSYADMLMLAAGVAAAAAFVRLPAERRALAWTPVSAPVFGLFAAGILSGLVIHREAGGAVLALVPLGRLVLVFAIGCVLFAGGHLRRPHVAVAGILVAQIVGAIGILNSISGGGTGNVITETTLPGGDAPVDERTVAFVDAAGPFVMAAALVALLAWILWGSRVNRVGLLILGVLPFVALVLSARRAMWVDFIIGAVIVAAISARVDRRALVGAVVALSVAGVAFVTITQASPAYSERLTGITSVFGESGESNIRSRQIENRAVWDNIQSHPVVGIGLTAPYLSSVQFQYQEPTYLHNNVLWVWLKFGILGLLALLWLFWRVAAIALQTARDLRAGPGLTEAGTTLAAAATLLGFFVAMLTASFLTASVRPPAIAGLLLALAGTHAVGIRAASKPLPGA